MKHIAGYRFNMQLRRSYAYKNSVDSGYYNVNYYNV